MKHLSILITRFPYESTMGGEEWHTITVAEGLQQKGHSVFLSSSCPHILQLFAKKNISHQKIWGGKDLVSKKALLLFPFTAPFFIPRLVTHLLWHKIFRKVNTLYCLTLNDKLFLTPFAKLLGINVFWVHHSTIGAWLQKNPFLWLYRFLGKKITIIAPSYFISKQIQELGIPARNLKVIPNGFDDEKFTVEPTMSLEQFWQGLEKNFESSQKKIGTVCRLSHEKGLIDLIQAAQICLSKNPNLQFFIVGDGPQKDKLISLIQQNGLEKNVFLLGFQDYKFINNFLHHIDLFVLPSHEEPFGIVLHEARYCRTPIIATKVGGIPEHVENGVDGILVNPNEPEQLSEAILQVLRDDSLAHQLVQNGFSKVQNIFRKKAMVDSLLLTF